MLAGDNDSRQPAVPAAIFDFDGTIVKARVWQSLTSYQLRHRHNLLPALVYPGLHYLLYLPSRLGLMTRESFIRAWAEHMPWLLCRLRVGDAEKLFEAVVRESLAPTLRMEAVDELRQRQQEGCEVILLSGTFEPLLASFGRTIGVRRVVGTRLEVREGRYTGRGLQPHCHGPGKPARLRQYLAEEGLALDWRRSYAYGDSIADAAVLSLVGNPVAVAPDDKLRRHAAAAGWRVLD